MAALVRGGNAELRHQPEGKTMSSVVKLKAKMSGSVEHFFSVHKRFSFVERATLV